MRALLLIDRPIGDISKYMCENGQYITRRKNVKTRIISYYPVYIRKFAERKDIL